MSQVRRSLAVMATLAAVAAVPASASAKTAPVSKNSVATVKASVADAQTAVKRLKRAVRLGQSTAAKRQLKIARTESQKASKVARRLANHATTAAAASSAAQALTIAGTQYDSLLETLTALVDDGPAQGLIAGAIQPTIAGKQQVITFLTGLLDKVPASVQPMLASIITALGAGDATEVTNLDNAIDVGDLPGTIMGIVQNCLDMATQAIESALDIVKSILPMLPEAAQGPINAIVTPVINQISSIVSTLVPSILSTVTGLIDTVLGSLPVIGGGSGAGAASGAGGLFGGLLGGLLGGGSSNVGGIGNMISNLLGGLGGATGGATNPVTGIIGTVTGLISNLLGGILGGGGLFGGAHA
jgi:phage-related protein